MLLWFVHSLISFLNELYIWMVQNSKGIKVYSLNISLPISSINQIFFQTKSLLLVSDCPFRDILVQIHIVQIHIKCVYWTHNIMPNNKIRDIQLKWMKNLSILLNIFFWKLFTLQTDIKQNLKCIFIRDKSSFLQILYLNTFLKIL